MEKIKKSATIGEHIVEVRENGSVKVYKIPRIAKAALRDCAEKHGMEYSDEKDTTQDIGRKLLKKFCEGASSGTIGEYHIERAENGHIDIYQEYKNTIGALREIIHLLKGLEWEDKWNTQDAGRKLVDYANAHPECILKKAPAKAPAKAEDVAPATEVAKEEVDYTKMTEANYDEINNHSWTDDRGVKYSLDKTRLLEGGDVEGEYEILPGTKVICDSAFMQKYDDLTGIVIPDSVVVIGNSAFMECGLESVHIPNSVKYIGECAFMDNPDLSDVRIPYTTKLGRFAFSGTEYYDSNPDRVESIIEAVLKPIGYDYFIDNDELDEDACTNFVAIVEDDGDKEILWSNYCKMTYDNFDEFLDAIDNYCKENFGKDSDEVEDLDIQYISDVKEITEQSSGYWEDYPDLLHGGVVYAARKFAEGDAYEYDGDEDEESEYQYPHCIHNREEFHFLTNTLFCITWANGEKQNLFVDMGGDVLLAERIGPKLRAASEYEQRLEEILASSVKMGKPVPQESIIKNIIEVTMVAHEGELTEPEIGRTVRKYNPDNEDTTLVATVTDDEDSKKFYFSHDPLWQLFSDASTAMEEYCEDELGLSIDDVDIKLEWPTDFKLLRGDADRSNQEAVIVPYAIDPSEEDADYYKEEDNDMYYKDMSNCLVRIHWSDGRIEDLFIDKDLQVYDFNTMDKSYFPECDRKSFDELIKE